MSETEGNFYKTLTKATEGRYIIFAQVHLPIILNHKIKGQNWRAAFRRISQKSVDFVLCDKDMSPVLAIELDDKTHKRQDRKERDIIVDRILEYANMPLLRIKNTGHFDSESILGQINDVVKQY